MGNDHVALSLVLGFFIFFVLLEAMDWYLKKHNSLRWHLYQLFGITYPDIKVHPVRMLVLFVILFFFGWAICFVHWAYRVAREEC